MRKYLKRFPVFFFVFIFSCIKITATAQNDFVTDINTLIESCKNDFSDLKGGLVTSGSKSDIYECTYQIKGYSTTYLAIDKGTNYTYVFASLSTTGSNADADCDRIARDFASIPNCTLYDSKNDPNSNEDRRLQGKIKSEDGDILINAVLSLSANSEIIVSIQKPNN